jgi:hypothetical protein
MLLAAALPMTRGFFDDARVPANADGWERLYQTLIRIPVGTVVFEELAFRAVLLALLCQRFSLNVAVALDSALFGLWHIVPTLSTATANGIEGLARLGLVAGSVIAPEASCSARYGSEVATSSPRQCCTWASTTLATSSPGGCGVDPGGQLRRGRWNAQPRPQRRVVAGVVVEGRRLVTTSRRLRLLLRAALVPFSGGSSGGASVRWLQRPLHCGVPSNGTSGARRRLPDGRGSGTPDGPPSVARGTVDLYAALLLSGSRPR